MRCSHMLQAEQNQSRKQHFPFSASCLPQSSSWLWKVCIQRIWLPSLTCKNFGSVQAVDTAAAGQRVADGFSADARPARGCAVLLPAAEAAHPVSDIPCSLCITGAAKLLVPTCLGSSCRVLVDMQCPSAAVQTLLPLKTCMCLPGALTMSSSLKPCRNNPVLFGKLDTA